MKNGIIGTCIAAMFGIAITASAQQPPQPQPAQPNPPAAAAPMADKADKDMKLSGCLKAGTEAGSFELATKKDAKKNVALAAGTGVDLAAHLNHQIEVTGSWDHAAAAAASDASKSDAAKKKFNVTAVKMVSATCTTGTN